MSDLPEPTRDDLKDEVQALVVTLVERHDATARGLRTIARRLYRTGKARPEIVNSSFRVASDEDLLGDLERAMLGINNRRVAMGAVNRGLRQAGAA